MVLCKVKGCGSNYRIRKGYCNKHYLQILRHKRILTETIYSPNKIIIKKNTAEIVLKDKSCKEVGRVIIDSDDVKKCRKYKWSLSVDRKPFLKYARTTINGKTIRLHKFLLNPKKYEYTDHINRNTLDCRRTNLRNITNSSNIFNCAIHKNNTSGVVGVSWNKIRNKWRAFIIKDRKQIELGCFINFDDAVLVRKQAKLKYFGEIVKR